MKKISIITVVKNSLPDLKFNFKSIDSQTFKNYEHLVIYSNSNDLTLTIIKKNLNKNRKIFFFNTKNIYKAINYGIKKSFGEYIFLLHSDDVLYNRNTLRSLEKKLRISPNFLYGNIIFFKKKNSINITKRIWLTNYIKFKDFFFGRSAPHVSFFIKRLLFYRIGFYKEKYYISSDYDFLIRLFKKCRNNYYHLNFYITSMKIGGLSTSFKNFFKKSKEDLDILKEYYGLLSYIIYFIKIIRKVKQFKSY